MIRFEVDLALSLAERRKRWLAVKLRRAVPNYEYPRKGVFENEAEAGLVQNDVPMATQWLHEQPKP